MQANDSPVENWHASRAIDDETITFDTKNEAAGSGLAQGAELPRSPQQLTQSAKN